MATRSASLPVLAFVIALVADVRPSAAQAGMIYGTVMRDSAGHPVGDVDVGIPALSRRGRSNWLGVYRFDEIPPGKYVVVVRLVGFLPAEDTIVVASNQQVEHDVILQPQVAKLDSVRVTAAAPPKYISPGLRGFEERRKIGNGHFIGEEDLRKADNQSLVSVITARLPGVQTFFINSETYLGSTRHVGDAGPTGMDAKTRAKLGIQKDSTANSRGCWFTVYVDGVRVYDATMTMRDPKLRPPDFRLNQVSDYAGIEFYAGTGTVPAQFSTGGTECGTLLLWTRER